MRAGRIERGYSRYLRMASRIKRICLSKRRQASQHARCSLSRMRSKGPSSRSCFCDTSRVACLQLMRCPRNLLSATVDRADVAVPSARSVRCPAVFEPASFQAFSQ